MTIIVEGFLGPLLLTRGLVASVVVPITVYPDPFLATSTATLNPFLATSTATLNPFAATSRLKGS
jgi:hypothetical protein